MAHPLWPLFDLRIRTDRLELRLPSDEELVDLCAVARAGIHQPEEMPFGVAWTDLPSPAFERSFIQHHWTMRATWRPEQWALNLGAFLDGHPIGSQSVRASDFAILRTVDTGSWLSVAHQGEGLGKEMRAGILAFVFDHLGAEVATSGAFLDNARSAAVSRSLGYEPDGIGRLAPRGVARDVQRFRMTRELWAARPRASVQVSGLQRCLELFGSPATG